jgi:hypothetical protein
MKTTIDIADPVLNDARKLAAKEGTTLRALVEQGLRKVIEERKEKSRFTARKVTFGEGGLRPEVRGLSWDEIRDLAYEDRGD